MTVAQLLIYLSELPPDTPVVVPSADHSYSKITLEVINVKEDGSKFYDPEPRQRGLSKALVIS